MRLQTYKDYKATKAEWLGDVPKHWNTKRLKMSAGLKDRKVEADPDEPMPYLGLENIESWTGRLLPIDDSVVPAGIANAFEKKHTLFGKLRPYLAKACNPKFDGLCSTELLVLQSVDLDRRNLLYSLLSDGFIKLVDSSTFGSKMPRANWDFIGNCVVPIPPPNEQRLIANFLDRATGKIDTLVGKKRELIEKLKEKRTALISRTVTRGLNPKAKLKPSGIEWLGDIPEHWETPALYTRYSIELGKMLNEGRITGKYLVPYLRNVDVQWDRINFVDLPEMDIADGEKPRYTLAEGDLVVCEGGEVGRAAIMPAGYKLIGYQKALHRMRPRTLEEVPRFMFYTLAWASGRGVFISEGNPNTIPHLTGEKLRRYRFPTPALKEQRAITFYLDRETAKIDKMMEKVEAAIEKLQEYRTALITAAVTGKIDVRETDDEH